jgi:hypothetical protein
MARTGSRGGTHGEHLSVRVPSDLHAALKRQALNNNMTLSAAITRALAVGLDHRVLAYEARHSAHGMFEAMNAVIQANPAWHSGPEQFASVRQELINIIDLLDPAKALPEESQP